jgi:hypothetical protein
LFFQRKKSEEKPVLIPLYRLIEVTPLHLELQMETQATSQPPEVKPEKGETGDNQPINVKVRVYMIAGTQAKR